MKKKVLALFLAAAMMFTGVMPMDVVKADEAGAGGGGDWRFTGAGIPD